MESYLSSEYWKFSPMFTNHYQLFGNHKSHPIFPKYMTHICRFIMLKSLAWNTGNTLLLKSPRIPKILIKSYANIQHNHIQTLSLPPCFSFSSSKIICSMWTRQSNISIPLSFAYTNWYQFRSSLSTNLLCLDNLGSSILLSSFCFSLNFGYVLFSFGPTTC